MNMTRGEFVAGMSASAAVSRKEDFIWCMYQQLGSHMWPPLFFLGMDEENPDNTSKCHLSVRRQGELLWHDIDFYAKAVQRLGARPWMAADYEWWEPDEYCKHVSKDILQTNWYYGYDFDFEKLTGVMRMPWVGTTSATDPKWIDACDQFGAALAREGAKW